jgi:hypothetical protein
MRNLGVLAGALALAACGGGESADNAGNVTAEPPAGITNAKVGLPANFNATDACSILDRNVVAEVMGSEVKSAEVSTVTAPTDATAGFSNCTYTLANGLTPQFFARWSPTPDSTPAAAEETVKQAADLLGKTPEKVAGLKSPAWWVSGTNQLHIFPDAQRYVFFTMFFSGVKPKPSDEQAKAWALGMAKRAGY